MRDDDGIGPWNRHRALHFEREHARGQARQRGLREAAVRVRNEADQVEAERRGVERAIDQAEVGTERWHLLVTFDERERERAAELRHQARRLRRQAEPTHAEILNEWSVQYDQVPPPAPGTLLMARSSKKPYRDR